MSSVTFQITPTHSLTPVPIRLYPPDSVREAERLAVEAQGVSLYQLMCKAGDALAIQIGASYPQAKHILVCCGRGNNGGDGYTLAQILKAQGIRITLWQVGDPWSLQGDAAQARDAWLAAHGIIASPQ